MNASIENPEWKYETAEESRKPGYLAKKFAKLRREIKQAEESRKPSNVEVLTKKARA